MRLLLDSVLQRNGKKAIFEILRPDFIGTQNDMVGWVRLLLDTDPVSRTGHAFVGMGKGYIRDSSPSPSTELRVRVRMTGGMSGFVVGLMVRQVLILGRMPQ